jgi:predicted MPP superfamily phosphohydrolase
MVTNDPLIKRPPTRRQMLRLGSGSLLAAGYWPGALRANNRTGSGDFHFIAVNDFHYLDKQCGPWFEKALKQMIGHEEKIAFILLLGDLAENGTKEQLGAVSEILKPIKVPVHVVVGNHDYRTNSDRKAFEELYPKFINYDFEHNGWQFVGLDTTEGLGSRNTSIQQKTFDWLDKRLPKLDKKLPTILFTHFPLGPLVPGRPKNAEKLLERFTEFNLQAVFCGHWHGITTRLQNRTTLTTNACCSHRRQNHDGTKEKGYLLCHAVEGKIERKFVEVKIT